MDSPGAMRSYIATLHDVSVDPPLQGFALPSSKLIPCQQDVGFSFVAIEHEYVARVQGYDRDDLRPQAAGSPNAVDSDGRVVAPRWTTECGQLPNGAAGAANSDSDSQGEGGDDGGGTAAPGFSVAGITATSNFTVYTSYCLPLTLHGPPSDTLVSVRLDQARRELECGDESGELAEFTVELTGATTDPLSADCTGTVEFGGLEAGQDYEFNVLAFEAGADEPRWQTTCRAMAWSGTVTPASCDPLSER